MRDEKFLEAAARRSSSADEAVDSFGWASGASAASVASVNK